MAPSLNDKRALLFNGTRYYALNLHATRTKGTIEFRCFNSTTHAGKMKSYVQLCLVVSNQALAQSGASFKPTNTDNDKYAMRCWLLKMGLIAGSEGRRTNCSPTAA